MQWTEYTSLVTSSGYFVFNTPVEGETQQNPWDTEEEAFFLSLQLGKLYTFPQNNTKKLLNNSLHIPHLYTRIHKIHTRKHSSKLLKNKKQANQNLDNH